MSDFTPGEGTQLTATELLMVQNLAAVTAAGANQFLRKLSTTTFEQTSPSSSGATLASENPVETPDGIITVFTFTHDIGLIELNGIAQFVGGNLFSATSNTVTFNTAPFSGDEVKNIYAS